MVRWKYSTTILNHNYSIEVISLRSQPPYPSVYGPRFLPDMWFNPYPANVENMVSS
jgi:hypothetical protein